MASPVFDITLPSLQLSDLQHSTLLIELGEKQLTCVWFNRNSQQLLKLMQYHIQHLEGSLSEWLQDQFAADPIFGESIKETLVVYNLADCLLFPASSFNMEINKPLVETFSGNTQKGLVLSEKIQGKNIYSIYRVSRDIHSLIQKNFSSGKYWHIYSLLLKCPVFSTDKRPCLQTVFYTDKMVVAVYGEEGLLLMQTYSYQQPEDVSWLLLNACRQLDLEPSTIPLEICGLVEDNSALFKELVKYFGTVEWKTISGTDWKNELLDEYPAHYFSALLNMALCV